MGYSGLSAPIPRSKLAQEIIELQIPVTQFFDEYGDPICSWTSGLHIDGNGNKLRISGPCSPEITPYPLSSWAEVQPGDNYVAAGEMSIFLNSFYVTDGGTIGSPTIDVEIKKLDVDGVETGDDLCVTPVQTVSATPTDYTFEINPATISPGDRLKMKITTTVAYLSGAFDVASKVGSVRLARAVKG